AATADLFLQIRAGSDIAFLGGLINYAIENGRIAREYVLNFTNAAFIVQDGFKLADDGIFSGFNAADQSYDKAKWNYEAGGAGRAGGAGSTGAQGEARGNQGQGAQSAKIARPANTPTLPSSVSFDPTLQHPR